MKSKSGSYSVVNGHAENSLGNGKTVTEPNAKNDGIQLQAQMGLVDGVSVIVGSIIGSGIFVSPKGVLANCGSVGLSLIVWLLCGLFSMIGSYCMAELGTSIRKTGGDYAYIYEAFGPFIAFLRMWTECMIVRPCLCAIVALTFGTYVIEPLFPDCEQPDTAIRLLAAICIILLTIINAWNVSWAVKVQDISTYAKILALLLIIITGIVQIARGEVEYFQNSFENTETDVGKVSLAFYSGLFAYNGWNYLNYVLEEVKEPKKNLPRAICISIVLVTSVYVLANVAYFSTVSPQEMLGGSAVAVIFTKRLYGVMWWIMPVFVSLSTFGGCNGILFTCSRIFFAASREGHMPGVLSMIQIERLTPLPAVIFTGTMSVLYLVSSDIFGLINYVSFSNWLAIGLSVFGLMVMRVTRPQMERPIKVALVWPIIYTVMSVFLCVLPFYASPRETGLGCLIILTGVPIYMIFVMWKKKPEMFTHYVEAATTFVQKLFLVVPEHASSKEE